MFVHLIIIMFLIKARGVIGFKIQAAKLIVQILMQKHMHVFNLLLSYSDYEELQVGGGECPVTLYTFI